MKVWMLLKTLVANARGEKLSYWNGKAIGCYTDISKNKVGSQCSFSLINSCPGYLGRYGVAVVSEENYSNPSLLDTPLYIGFADVGYEEFRNRRVTEDVLRTVEEKLHGLFSGFLKQYQTSHH